MDKRDKGIEILIPKPNNIIYGIISGFPLASLKDLKDVDINNLCDGDSLIYNAKSGNWQNQKVEFSLDDSFDNLVEQNVIVQNDTLYVDDDDVN